MDYPGAHGTFPNSINGSGQIVGYYQDASTHGFFYSSGSFSSLDVPFAIQTWASGINDNGEVVGDYEDVNGNIHGFLYNGDFSFPFGDVVYGDDDLLEVVGSDSLGHGVLYTRHVLPKLSSIP